FSIAPAIEVGGHITEDTTWSPDNNPYHVIDDVFVDEGVTLNILPGTIVKFNAALLASYQDMDNFVYYNGANIAKMLQVDGKLIADGTEEEPITFTRIQDSLYYHWGIIYLTEFADKCIFRYCHFEYSAYLLIVLGIIPCGAVSIYNEEAIIEHCTFVDNFTGVFLQFFPQRIIIKDNYFFNIDNISPTYPGYHVKGGINIAAAASGQFNPILIAGNIFNESDVSYFYLDVFNTPVYVVDNQFFEGGIDADMDSEIASYFYINNFINCDKGIDGNEPTDSLYIKKNNFINCSYGMEINYAYIEVSDNYIDGCDITTQYAAGKIWNNLIYNGEVWIPGDIEVYNNICSNHDGYGLKVGYNPYCVNNISINNAYDIWSATISYENCIIIKNEELTQYTINGNPIFRNCIIDFELEYPLIDGGGNIWVDSLQAQTL
ncbi:MAG: hypothetical protein KAT74_02685, partial [Candidatus Cloacimonetes bacterium]|nr:hypothetical protein [Candidatus Cloacimonadota bacterium]